MNIFNLYRFHRDVLLFLYKKSLQLKNSMCVFLSLRMFGMLIGINNLANLDLDHQFHCPLDLFHRVIGFYEDTVNVY